MTIVTTNPAFCGVERTWTQHSVTLLVGGGDGLGGFVECVGLVGAGDLEVSL